MSTRFAEALPATQNLPTLVPMACSGAITTWVRPTTVMSCPTVRSPRTVWIPAGTPTSTTKTAATASIAPTYAPSERRARMTAERARALADR